MQKHGRTLTLVPEEALMLARWLERQVALGAVGREYTEPALVSALAAALREGGSVRIKKAVAS